MNYQFDRYWLDTTARTLISAQGEQSIRPKTLALLLYLIEHQTEIISKEKLLADIWDDVGVNEGVIFQSVREIRKLFDDNGVIQNHPRKGYQWVGRVTPLSDLPGHDFRHAKSESTVLGKSKKWTLLLTTIMAAGGLIGLAVWLGLSPTTSNPQLLLSPVQNQVDNLDHRALEADGTQKLYTLLADLNPSLSVSVSGQPSNQSDSERTSAFTWQLSSAIYGDVYDYKLVYRLTNPTNERQGVIFSRSIERAFQLLVEITSANIQQAQPQLEHLQPEAFQDKALARAMVAYETDWEAATTQLHSYLQQYPESVLARQYLSRLYIWQGDNGRALELITPALNRQTLSPGTKAELLYNQALAYRSGQPERALAIIDQAISMAEQPETWLTRAKLEELGADIDYQQDRSVQALRRYIKAQSLYDQIQASTSLAGLKLKLAALYIGNGEIEMAKNTFLQAKTMIQQQEMSFLYAALMEFEQHHQVLLY